MNLKAERTKVRRKFPHAHAYKWDNREWVIYASKDGPFVGIALSGSCTSQAAAWISAASSEFVTGKRRK